MNIVQEIKNLNLPIGNYVVVGSGILIAHKLKEGHDIDIVVSKQLFEKCKSEGWDQIPWTYEDKIGNNYLRKNNVELYLDVNKGDFNPSLEELLLSAEIIDDVPFASFQDILKFKKEYSKVNPKHLTDIVLIEDYLKTANKK